MSTPAPEEHKPETPKAPKGPMIFGAISVLNLVLSGFIAANIAFATTEEYEEETEEHGAEAEHGGGHEEAKADEGHGGGHGEGGDHSGDSDNGLIVTLDPFIVNLNEPGSNRYLKATFEVEMSSSRGVSDVKASKRNVRDEIFRYLSSLSVADTLGESSKARIQREVLTRIEREIGRNMVKRLFFTEFVIQ